MFLIIFLYHNNHITNEEMFNTSKILYLGSKRPKVAENVLTLRNVAQSCSFAKKLLEIPKIAKKLPRTIWIGRATSDNHIL